VFPFDRPTNYNEMLNKIGLFTFIEALLLTLLLGWASPQAGRLLASYAIPIKVFSVELPLLYVVPAVIIALIARILKLHNRVSDFFGVRGTFDLYRVLMPLAGALGVAVDGPLRARLAQQRKSVMQATFYRFASFEEPKISKALVLSAIDCWTWYWILSELLVLLAVTGALLLFLRVFTVAAYVFLGIWLMTILFCSCYRVCGAMVDHQISEMILDPERVHTLQEEFRRLVSEPKT
jgi:hypothetical protein